MTDGLVQLPAQITRVVVPVIIIVGILGNSVNIVILTRPSLKRRACSLYFLGLAINNLFYSSLMLTFNLLADGYQLDPSRYSNFFCKLISYLLNLCPTLSISFIVLASIDRFCASSIDAQRRKFSNVRVARWLILLVVLVLAFFFIGIWVAFEIRQDDTLGCATRSNIIFNQIFLILEVTLFVIIGPSLMITFGLLTVYNTNQLRVVPQRLSRRRRTERQLVRMLLVQVITHLLLVLPFCAIFLMLILPISFQSSVLFSFFYVIFKIPFYLSFTTPFFLYILSAQIYRAELIRLLNKIVGCRCGATVEVMPIQNNHLPMHTSMPDH